MGLLSEIETFIMVAEKGSFSAVAKGLGISTAAVSKQMTQLESKAEVQLLIRSTRKIELTEMGRAYLTQCHRIMEEVDASTALLSQMKVEPSGILNIFSHSHFARNIIIPGLPDFIDLYPKIEINLSIGETVPRFESENLDIFIGASASAQEDAIQRRIATTEYIICASPQYLEKYGTPKSPDDLSKHRCLAHSGRDPYDRFYGQGRQYYRFKPYIRVNDTDSLARLAELGIGIVQLHHYVVQDLIKKGQLIPILEGFSRRDVPIYYSLPPRKFTPRKVQCFIEFIMLRLQSGL